jgi:urease accessory protein
MVRRADCVQRNAPSVESIAMRAPIDYAPLRDSPAIASTKNWAARLDLRCESVENKSLLTRRSHFGPLRLLKPLYPEGDRVCHAVIVHPPGGIVGGDELETHVTVAAGAHLTVTTPGAQKWYRSDGELARAHTALACDAQGALEWIPQETIVFDGAHVAQSYRIALNRETAFFGWDIVCFGRTSSNERFRRGLFRQRIEVFRDDRLLWSEHMVLRGDDRLLDSPLGWNRMPIVASAWIGFPKTLADDRLLGEVRAVLCDTANAAASNPCEGLIVVKAVGDSAEAVRGLLIEVWRKIRLTVFDRPPQTPRIWNT